MKTRFILLHPKVLLRGGALIAVLAALAYLTGPVLGSYINYMYISSDNNTLFKLFYFISTNRHIIVALCCIVAFLLASGWILQPLFVEYSAHVRDNIRLAQTDDESPVALPSHLKPLEDALNQVNTQIRLSKYAAKEAEQRKDDLVVYLAHDIRTPLTSVLGYLELLSDAPDLPEPQRRKYTDAALRKAGRMQVLVEELFEVTRYSITQIELERTAVNLGVMLRQLAEELRPLMEQRSVELEFAQGDQAAGMLLDADKIARAFDNILHNAVYYTPPGGRVNVALRRVDGGGVIVTVSNTGTDIPQEKLNRFFEKFYRGEEARRSTGAGSGLGLAIAKSIIEAHGGTISAENRDQITTFTVSL